MKPGICFTLLLILLLGFAGCSRKESANRPDRKNQGTLQTIESRFRNISVDLQESDQQNLSTHDTLIYYRPTLSHNNQKEFPPAECRALQNHSKKQIIAVKSSFIRSYPVVLKAGSTSQEAFFTATFDNDIIDYTDYYFTNGIGFELFHPLISASPLATLLPGLKFSTNYYGLTFIQNMYTPLKLNKPEILVGDRPFASYLVLGHLRISLSPERHRRLQTELSLGVIGPGALGNFAQDMIHDETPTGWQYQVRNDFVVSYSVRYDQGIYTGKSLKIALVGGGQAGTLYDNIMGGLFLQVGRANDRYGSIFQIADPQKPYRKRIRYYFSLDVLNKMIFYDATLEGGMFNRENAYTIEYDKIKRYVFSGKAGFGIGLGKYSLEAEQVFLTPEFDGGRHHMWFRIKNVIRIN